LIEDDDDSLTALNGDDHSQKNISSTMRNWLGQHDCSSGKWVDQCGVVKRHRQVKLDELFNNTCEECNWEWSDWLKSQPQVDIDIKRKK
jgi:hypothetical protein